MTAADCHLLYAVRAGLAEPFADPVDAGGVTVSRATARAIERQLARLAVNERRAA
jgi:hypothetical protein